MQSSSILLQASLSHEPISARPGSSQSRTESAVNDKPPRKPDWLLIMVCVLFLLTVLIAWLVGVPILGR